MTWAPSEIVRGELERNGFANTRVWSRGVDPHQFHRTFRSNELRRKLGVTDDGVLAIYVGRLAPEKGIDVALEAMRLVMDRNGPKVSFALAGHGPDEARCRAIAPPRAVFAGRLTGRALSEFYASADIFVFPSITETFGNVVLEAMSSHLALVAPDWGATTELATAETSLQFPASDPLALADRIERLVHDCALRGRLADAAVAAATTRSWDAVFDRLVADYREVLKRRLSDRVTPSANRHACIIRSSWELSSCSQRGRTQLRLREVTPTARDRGNGCKCTRRCSACDRNHTSAIEREG